ncbi:MAG: aminopeptidase P N-terminal domain-containing protein [bacterium]
MKNRGWRMTYPIFLYTKSKITLVKKKQFFMKNRILSIDAFVFITFLVFQYFNAIVFSQDLDFLSPEIYARRRSAVLAQLPDSSVAVFHSAKVKIRSNDIEYEYHQANNLYYLTGITDHNTVLVLVKEGIETDSTMTEEILFVPKPRHFIKYFEGPYITVEEAKNELGFEVVKTYDMFNNELENFLKGRKILFYSFQTEFLHNQISDKRYFLGPYAKETIKEKFPELEVKSPRKILSSLRQIKSPEELQLMRKAIDITCVAHIEAMRSAKPGMYEYQLEAIIEYIFKWAGAEYSAFPSTVGSGPNSTILHYWKNRRKMQAGDVVVMDIGAEYHSYAADVTRTIPVSGKFTKEQQEIYEIVLRAQKDAMAAIKPGVRFRDIHKVAQKVITDAGYGKYFIHSTSHYVGLDVHDVGDYGLLQPGMVITVEPGIYIREGAEADKAYWNIGVRIEDDVLITPDGYKILSDKAPREIAEIETLMKQDSKVSFNLE